MDRNIIETGFQIPELFLLIKDHKFWKEEEGKPLPSRPVLSGNCCPNTHLSELVSELVEPVSTRLQSAEIKSTEEALNKITTLNKRVRRNRAWTSDSESNVLRFIGSLKTGPNVQNIVVSSETVDKNVSTREDAIISDEESDTSLLEALDYCIKTGCEAENILGKVNNCDLPQEMNTNSPPDVFDTTIAPDNIDTTLKNRPVPWTDEDN